MIKKLASRIFPSLDYKVWNWQRDGIVREMLGQGAYLSFAEKYPEIAPNMSVDEADSRPSHVIVVPAEGPAFRAWGPGTRNFYYEAAQILVEDMGQAKVTVFRVEPGEEVSSWQIRLMELAIESNATHILTHIEEDPTGPGSGWNWDVMWAALNRRWNGVLLGVMFDSAFAWILTSSKRLARMSPKFVAVDICMPMHGVLVRGRTEVGPVNMPMSHESMALVDARTANLVKEYDVSFIGALYPYRVEMLETLRSNGVSVAVNPHREDETRNFLESRTDQPNWLDYMAGLKKSELTINFSRSSAGPFEQYKTRILEAALVGCLPLTDDRVSTCVFFTDHEYAFFDSPETLPKVVEDLLSDPSRLREMQDASESKARSLAHTNFWHEIDLILKLRNLPMVYGRNQAPIWHST